MKEHAESQGDGDCGKEDYMKSALHGDALALRQVLGKYNASLAAEWEAAHAEYEQRGILMLAGPRNSHMYLVNAFVTLWVVRRHLKSKLPIVIMYWGETESVDPVVQEFFQAELGDELRFVDASLLPWPAHHRGLFLPGQTYEKPGWAFKLAAMYLAPFKEVLYLDTDSAPLVNPDTLFDLPDYKRSGNAFWPASRLGRPPIFKEIIEMGLINEADAPENMRQTEAGQVLFDKRRYREPLEYMLFLGGRSLYAFPLSYGDKELFLAGFALAGVAADYRLVRQTLGLAWGPSNATRAKSNRSWTRQLRGLVHFSPVDGRPLFLHRYLNISTKYRLQEPEGRPLDVISGPLPPEMTSAAITTKGRLADPNACPYPLDEGLDVVDEQCIWGTTANGESRAVVYPVEGTAMGAAHAAQEAGWRRLLKARSENTKLFPPST